jgi:hypothetical protein
MLRYGRWGGAHERVSVKRAGRAEEGKPIRSQSARGGPAG